jgi:hypothetical protein
MSEPIVYIDRSTIREGKLEQVKAAIVELVAFIEAKEPQLVSYSFHLDEEERRMTVVAVHPDSASLELHMSVGGPAFRKFADWIDMSGIEIYGEPSEAVLNLLRQKAQMLGRSGSVLVHKPHAGFSRVSVH